MVLISKHPFSSIAWHRNPVACLVVQLALLELVVELENGLAILLDGLIEISTAQPLQASKVSTLNKARTNQIATFSSRTVVY